MKDKLVELRLELRETKNGMTEREISKKLKDVLSANEAIEEKEGYLDIGSDIEFLEKSISDDIEELSILKQNLRK